eukprot:gene7872-9241_t
MSNTTVTNDRTNEQPLDLSDLVSADIKQLYVREPPVRIFWKDNDQNPWHLFHQGCSWAEIKENANISKGFLKIRGDTENKCVPSPFQSGDYTVVNGKTHGFF